MERKKRKFLFWVLIAGLCCVAVLGIMYACLAFMPTGYDEVAKSIAPAKQNVSRLMAPRFVSVPDGSQSQAPEGRSRIPNAPPSESLGPLHKLTFYEELLSYEVGSVINPMISECRDNALSLARDLAYTTGEPVFVTAFDVDQPLSASLVTLGVKQREELTHAARSGIARRWRVMKPDGEAGYRHMPQAIALSESTPFLDELEDFLLRPQWDLSIPTGPIQWADIKTFHYAAMMAVMRASLRGDQPRAILLLDRYLEAIRLMKLFYMQHPGVGYVSAEINLTVLWMNLATLPDFAAEGWEHAARGVAALRLSAAETADVRRVRAFARRSSLVQALDQSNQKVIQNTWHYMGGGAPESVVNKALYPLAIRRIDRMARCEYDGDLKGWVLNAQGLNTLITIMNRTINTHLLIVWPEKLIDYDSVRFGQPCPFDCRTPENLTLERFPAFALDSLQPGPGISEGEWMMRQHGYVKDSPLGRFYEKNKHEPDTPEEIESVLRESGNDANLSAAIKWFAAQSYVVCCTPIEKSFVYPHINMAVRFYHPGAIILDEMKRTVGAAHAGAKGL
ncbi:MAG: hypothetical protein ABFD69_01925 [Candidatus Sumerlaeia bacterium]